MTTSLARRLGLADAVVVGLGAMIGAGVFVAFAPAAARAGSLVWAALAVAAVVAVCNALSSARLAARFPSAGGTYVYGRELLGPLPGFLAGWEPWWARPPPALRWHSPPVCTCGPSTPTSSRPPRCSH